MAMSMIIVILIIGLVYQETEVLGTRIWSSSSVPSVAKPDCRDRCGNLSIPYPFGIGKGCYFDKHFEVMCHNNTLFRNIRKVYSISLMDHFMIARMFFSPNSYNRSSGKNIYTDVYSTGGSNKYFGCSAPKNKLVGIGCDIYAYLKDAHKSGEIVSGCASFCNKPNITDTTSPSDYCTGSNGCCQTTISRMSSEKFVLSIQTMNTQNASWASTNCSYLLIVEKGDNSDFTQLLNKCNDDDGYDGRTVFDWAINGNVSCDKAKKGPKYACGKNTRCMDDTSRGAGYKCYCSHGYQYGNPYLPNGCQDINECESPNGTKCPNNTRCANTPGSFLCEPINVKHMLAMQLSLGFVVAIVFLTLVAVCLWLRKWLRKREEKKVKQKYFKRNGGFLLQQRIPLYDGGSSGNPLLNLFLKEELEKATNNFNENRILGKGGLGTVYKGMLSDGSIVAVKKSNAVDGDQIEQFINEILILSQINHRHIVKVLGCCLETQVPLLVYEYISNGTLSSHIHSNLTSHSSEPSISKSELDVQSPTHSRSILSWDQRLRIATEVAGALSYMHSCASTPILHRDIKSSNILLDDSFRAVVSDFGLSRLMSVDKTHLTTLVGGTFGYIDPEYFRSGQLTDKCDVYAFGVILAELLTSQRVVSSNKTEDPGLVMRFKLSLQQNHLFEIVDPEIVKENENEKEILVVAKLAKRCLNFNARKRSCMKAVAAELERLSTMRQHVAHGESCRGNISPVSESSHSFTSDCTTEEEDDDQNAVSHN